MCGAGILPGAERLKREDRDFVYLSSVVAGSDDNSYCVSLRYNKSEDQFEEHFCECEAWQTYSGMCKHCVAMALEAYYSEAFGPSGSQEKEAGNIHARNTDKELTDIIYASSMKEKAQYLQPELTGYVHPGHIGYKGGAAGDFKGMRPLFFLTPWEIYSIMLTDKRDYRALTKPDPS